MKFLKNKTLWFIFYGIVISVVFLYVLFPSDIIKGRLEEAFTASGFVLKTESLRSSFPFGIKMKNFSLGSRSSVTSYIQGQSIDVQFNPFSFLSKSKSAGVDGQAYGGHFSGRFGFASFSKMYPPQEGKLIIRDIDLGKCAIIKSLLGRDITGRASGDWTFKNSAERDSSGTIHLFLKKGYFSLTEPFLGLSRIDFNRGEVKAILQNNRITLEKMEVFGQQLDCLLNGEISLAEDFMQSQINLNGEMIIAEKKVKMKINISGTLANPAVRYI